MYDDAYKKNDEVADDAPAADVATADADVVTPGEALPSDRVADLVEYVVCGLVDDVNAVSLDVIDSAQGTLIEVTCSEQDTGKVIGRRGRTIKAIRTLARALGQRVGTSVDVEVLG
ncbi:KH domain-containing protein [Atopobium deltae]|uniref:KH domain-containing protein n=1 Tax=Atopobium deltae TaxID=1393034 RepID=UPI0009EB150E